MLQKKTNGAPNGFYAEIDWDRYVSVSPLSSTHAAPQQGTRAVLTHCLLAFWVAVAVLGDVQGLVVVQIRISYLHVN